MPAHTTAQLATLAAITFTVADLAGNAVGEHSPGHIVIDTDAAGHGWFVDSTLSDNVEFAHAANADGTELFADPASAAAGHLDLLTAVVHEMGHELGLAHSDEADDVMADMLVDGERRLPDAADLAQANATAPSTTLMPAVALGPAVTPNILPGPASTLADMGTAGNGSALAKFLLGGAGADNFVFAHVGVDASLPPPLTHVAGHHFAGADSFDFSALPPAFHGLGALEDASGSFATLQASANGPWEGLASWVDVAQFDGAHASGLADLLLAHNAIRHAQIHLDLLA